jgi:hypothetical protein
MTSDVANAALDAGFFDGRFMVEIRDWDWNLYLALSNPKVPKKYRFQGGLNYSRGIEIIGRVRAPSPHRGKLMRIWLSPFGSETTFGDGRLDRVGQFYRDRLEAIGADFEASLHLPESALSPAITCLSSVWRYLDIWIDEYQGDEAPVTAFSFSASIHPNLKEWAGVDLDEGLR